MAFSSVTLSGLSSDVCFFISTKNKIHSKSRFLVSAYRGETNRLLNNVCIFHEVDQQLFFFSMQWNFFKIFIQSDLLNRNSCLCVFHLHPADSRIHALPFSKRATLGSLCTGRIKSSTRVWRPHSGLAWLIWIAKWKKMWLNGLHEKKAHIKPFNYRVDLNCKDISTFKNAWNLGFCLSHLTMVSLLISKKLTNGG